MQGDNSTTEVKRVSRRPIGVWIISIYYALMSGLSLLSVTLAVSGALKLPAVQEAYYESLTGVDWVLIVAIAGFGTSAAVSLFLLRQVAVTLFDIVLTI